METSFLNGILNDILKLPQNQEIEKSSQSAEDHQ